MLKKLFGVGVLVFLLSSSLALAQYKVDLLAYYQMGWWDPPYNTPWSIENPYDTTTLDSGTQLTLQVPPCPKGKAIACDLYLAVNFRESMNTSQLAVNYYCRMDVKSSIIPEDIIITQSAGICNFSSPQDGIHPTMPPLPIRRTLRHLMERDKQNWWGVNYKTGGTVPVDEATKLINALITKGYDIEFGFYGSVQGIEFVRVSNFAVYISSISR